MAGRALSIEQREELAFSLAEVPEMTWTSVGLRVGVHRTTVTREVTLNGGRQRYCAVAAQHRADLERRRQRQGRLCAESVLRQRVTAELVACRSPAVRGHEKVPAGGQMRSPLVATESPRWWPAEVPTPR
jgi:IS30 family transposase